LLIGDLLGVEPAGLTGPALDVRATPDSSPHTELSHGARERRITVRDLVDPLARETEKFCDVARPDEVTFGHGVER
jgi:hypothetical protein